MNATQHKFAIGSIVCTPGARDAITPEQMTALIQRHVAGDWGEVPPEDAKENEFALGNTLRILSVYTVNDTKVWIITEADRSVTTVLLPSEY
jgi:hypothetical protein